MASKKKQRKMIEIREDGTVLLRDVRLSYEHIFEKWAGENSEKERYSAVFILPNETHEEAREELMEYLQDLAKDEIEGKVKRDNFFLRDGDDSGKDEYADAWTVNAAEPKRRPTVLNRDKSPITADDDVIYSGCWVNVLIRPWAQDNKFGRRVNANLLMVQFVRDDSAFSGASVPDADDVFDDLEDEGFEDRKSSKKRRDDDDDRKSSKKRRDRDEEEEERSSSRKRRNRDEEEEEEEDDRKSSKKRRSRDEEEEEEEEEDNRRSSGKRRPRDDDQDDRKSSKKRRSRDEDDGY